jgi:hypothetical protein
MFKFFVSTLLAGLGALAGGTAHSQMSADQSSQYLSEARASLEQQISKQTSSWHLGEAQTWTANFLEGTLRFRAGEAHVGTAKIQVIGSYNKTDRSFTWGWDHPAATSEPLRQHALLVLAWGRKADMPALINRKVPCTEQEAWNFAALANRLAKTDGVFRGPSGTAWIFMTLSDVRIEAAKP